MGMVFATSRAPNTVILGLSEARSRGPMPERWTLAGSLQEWVPRIASRPENDNSEKLEDIKKPTPCEPYKQSQMQHRTL